MSGDGLLGAGGSRFVADWATAAAARARAAALVVEHRTSRTEVLRNPHQSEEWARAVVRSPRLLAAVSAVIGPDVAVENTFLVIKWPGSIFEVPWHQDGINDRIELDPKRSVAAWLALTDARQDSGCLHVMPGSQRAGYLPYGAEDDSGAVRGRALGAVVPAGVRGVPVPVMAGSGLLMDPQLLHRSGSNQGEGARLGLNIRFVAPDGVQMRDGSSPSLVPVSGSGW
ncbi:phytanoyl-CoA dioxygenase family protein [Streptomyces sp. NBC_01465]|uniref:phytanoyl-CoA dioxygenase family protein n=1 Tax=Streptomyces sp. NBC_01465 TaxID=2903878 RepID=UPI002E3291A0|nr:phytanoyl-CoA dioxygenase family protein [Streptomyces sp. NBC_01465]